ncbi:unnamed protein product [Mucor fragilis]
MKQTVNCQVPMQSETQQQRQNEQAATLRQQQQQMHSKAALPQMTAAFPHAYGTLILQLLLRRHLARWTRERAHQGPKEFFRRKKTTRNVIQQQRIKNIRTNSAMLRKLSEIVGHENLFVL